MKHIKPHQFFVRHSAFVGMAVVVTCLLSGNLAQAAPSGLLYLPLTGVHGAGTTMTSAATDSKGTNFSGGTTVTLGLYSAAAGTGPTDLHGASGSGVLGVGGALDCTGGGTATGSPSSANYNAQDKADANLATFNGGLPSGNLTNFIVTFWFNQAVSQLASTIGPRLFILQNSTTAYGDTGVANSIGVKFQTATPGQLYFAINGNNPVGTPPSLPAGFPANTWEFVAFVYDGANLYQYDGSSGAACTLAGSQPLAAQTVALGTSASLILGGRWTGSRGLNGWMQDFRIYGGTTGSSATDLAFVEAIRAQLAPLPQISNLSPSVAALQQGTGAGQQLSFTASSPSGANIASASVSLNGGATLTVGSGLTASPSLPTATPTITVVAPLPQQQINTAVISVRDANGLSVTNNVTFDTFSSTNFMIKAEEFDHDSGQFIDNPSYTDGNPPDTNSYYGLSSVEEVDTHKGPSVGADNAATAYRFDDGSGAQTQTQPAAGELTVPRIANAPLDGSGNPQTNHMISAWSSGEWQNYTKTFPSGNYNVWARLLTSSGSTINFDQVTSGRGTTSQTTSRLGQFILSGSGWQWVELMQNGSPAVVNLAGVNTVRATSGGGASANLYMFVPANSNLPTISNVNPNGAYLFQYPTGGKLTFTVSSSTTTINTANVVVTLNGNNVSSSVTYTGGPSTWNGTYSGLLPNQTYATTIHVTDANGGTANATLSIDTWQPIMQFEAEDFDFDPTYSPVPAGNGLRFIDNPAPTSVPTTLGTYQVTAANSYEGQTGDEGIDQSGVGAGTRPYRPGDVATAVVVDTPRAQFAHNQDFNVGFLGPGMWQQYTRTWPTGTFNLYTRVASGANLGTLYSSWSQVIDGWGTANQITRHIGSFAIPSAGGYSAYFYTPLIDTFGNYAQLTLGGTNTFRDTHLVYNQTERANPATYGLNFNFYMLVAAATNLCRIDSVYPDGTTQMQPTNTFSFVASSPTYGINTTNIHVTLNGTDVSSLLAFSGSSGSWEVTYPGLQTNTYYTAVITVTDANNQTHTTTVAFDTFNPNNFTWEAEDYDFEPIASPVPNGSGLRYIDNPALTSSAATNSYFGQTGEGGQFSGFAIDCSALFGLTRPGTYIYRGILDYVSTEVTSDTLRQKYLNAQLATDNPAIADYDVNFWATNGWINYTRTFPAGKYYLYARLSAATAFNLQAALVTSGAGTPTQVTQPLGSFIGSGTSFTTWQYVPLVDANTNHVILSLGGVATLQFTGDYNENVNYFELVPVTAPIMTASASGSSILLSFPTRAGFKYTVYYKNNVTDAGWTALGASVQGDGTAKVVSDGIVSGSKRFYRLGAE